VQVKVNNFAASMAKHSRNNKNQIVELVFNIAATNTV
jgi:hypothetical protein